MRFKISISRLWLHISIILIFLGGVFSPELILGIELSLLVLNFRKIKLTKGFVFFVITLTVHGIIGVIAGSNETLLLVKQIAGIGGNLLFYMTVVKDDNHLDAIDIYSNYSFGLALFSIAQQIAHILGISFIYDLRWIITAQAAPTAFYRSSGFFTEPAVCALVLAPVMFIGIYFFIGKNRNQCSKLTSRFKSIIFILGFICTFSSSGYIGAAFTFVFIWLEYRHGLKQIFILVLIIAAAVTAYEMVADFRLRVDETIMLFLSDDSNRIANLSSQTLYLNYKIALQNFAGTFGFGGGLGSHQVAYEKYVGLFDTFRIQLLLNQQDANSLLWRLLSEIGVSGLAGVVFFLYSFRTRSKMSYDGILSRMCLMYFCLRLLRYGHYFNMGFFFFVVIYMITAKRKSTMRLVEVQNV